MIGELKKLSGLTTESGKELVEDIQKYSDSWTIEIPTDKIEKLASKYRISIEELKKHIEEAKEGYENYLEELRDTTLALETYR